MISSQITHHDARFIILSQTQTDLRDFAEEPTVVSLG